MSTTRITITFATVRHTIADPVCLDHMSVLEKRGFKSVAAPGYQVGATVAELGAVTSAHGYRLVTMLSLTVTGGRGVVLALQRDGRQVCCRGPPGWPGLRQSWRRLDPVFLSWAVR